MGESITGGLLAAWLVQSGDAVRKGQPLFSYETDKVTSEGTAEIDGQLTIAVPAGTEVLVGQIVASIEAGAADRGVVETFDFWHDDKFRTRAEKCIRPRRRGRRELLKLSAGPRGR
ncbi:MAG: lipoyl domain-containing protein [Verrucomicrobiota bacterium]